MKIKHGCLIVLPFRCYSLTLLPYWYFDILTSSSILPCWIILHRLKYYTIHSQCLATVPKGYAAGGVSVDSVDSDDSDDDSFYEDRAGEEDGASDDYEDSDDDDEREFGGRLRDQVMDEYQRMMDGELFSQPALAESFERVESTIVRSTDDTGATAKGGEGGDVPAVDIETNLLKNLLESHAHSLGLNGGPASQLLSQFGIKMPKPPSMSSHVSSESDGKAGATVEEV